MSGAATTAGHLARSGAGGRRKSRLLLLATVAVLVVLPHVPGLDSDFARSVLTQMGIAAVFALSFNLLFGQTGLLSFGHAVYFGFGGYAAIHLMRAINHGLPLPILLVPLAGAAGGLFGALLLGSVTTRRAGTIFALISLGVGELVYAATFMLPGIFGGEEGITASRTRASVDFGFALGSQLHVYYAVLLWAVAAALAMYAFTRTPAGRMCNAVRDNPERAEFVGYNTRRVRLVAFAMAGLFAGLAGGLHAINYEIVSADAVSAQRSGTVLIMAYIGGSSYFIGPILGAIAITWLQSSLSDYTSAWLFYLGVFFIVMILYAPSGLAGLIMMHRPVARPRALGPVLAAYGVALLPLGLVAA
ncbi:MAG: branched-chain amino acid ABC transporter permease, partial [Casimicrobiaceae bacterium]